MESGKSNGSVNDSVITIVMNRNSDGCEEYAAESMAYLIKGVDVSRIE